MATLNLGLDHVREALKLWYLDGLRYQLNEQASAFLAQLEKTSHGVEGDKIVMALRYGRVGGIGNRDDDGTLPKANSRKTKQAKWETKNIFSRFKITDKTIAVSRSNIGSFARLLQQEIEDCETDAKLDLSRQVLGDGVGVLATVSTQEAYATNVVTVNVDTTMYLAEGMLVDILQAGGTQRSAGVEEKEILEVVNETQFKMAADSDPTTVATDIVVVAGNHDKEMTGVEAVFNQTNTIYEIDRTEHSWFKATRENVNGEISETEIQKAIDTAELKSGAKTNFMITSHGVRRAYQNLQTAMKQHVNTMDLKGGWKVLSYNGIPMVADKYIKPGKLYCLDMDNWAMYQVEDWDWLDKDGAMLARITDKAAWEATLVKYCDLGCDLPRGQVELYGITEH